MNYRRMISEDNNRIRWLTLTPNEWTVLKYIECHRPIECNAEIIAGAVGLSWELTHRILRTLVKKGYVTIVKIQSREHGRVKHFAIGAWFTMGVLENDVV